MGVVMTLLVVMSWRMEGNWKLEGQTGCAALQDLGHHQSTSKARLNALGSLRGWVGAPAGSANELAPMLPG